MAAVRLTEDTTPFVHTTLRARKWDLYNTHCTQIEASIKCVEDSCNPGLQDERPVSPPSLPISAHSKICPSFICSSNFHYSQVNSALTIPSDFQSMCLLLLIPNLF